MSVIHETVFPGDPRQKAIAQICVILDAAMADWLEAQEDHVEARLRLMSAASAWAGAQCGLLIKLGAVDPDAVPTILESVAGNFHHGIDVGRDAVIEVAGTLQ